MTILQKSHLNLPLSPTERALLRTGESLIGASIITAFSAIYPLLQQAQTGQANWYQLLSIFLSTFLLALLLGVVHYFRARGDAPLADALQTVETVVETQTGVTLPHG